MTRLEKIIEAVNPRTEAEDIKRLNNGALSHIGDAIEAGEKEIMFNGRPKPVFSRRFYSSAERYQRIKSTYTLAGVEVPRPLVEKPEMGATVWFATISFLGEPICLSQPWVGIEPQLEALKAGFVYKTGEGAESLSEALSKLAKNAIKEALANS